MPNFDPTNRGAIWPNKRKEKATHPDFTGSINIEGVEYWVNAWKKKPDAKEGAPSLSFSVKKKEPRNNQQAPAQQQQEQEQQQSGFDSFEDDIPFMRLQHEYLY